jgi:PKD repeat protein
MKDYKTFVPFNQLNERIMIKNITRKGLLYIAISLTVIVSCKEDEVGPSKVVVSDFSFAANQNNTLEVTFTSDAENASHFGWNFGDGKTSTDENPVHVYAKPGTYAVTFIAKSKEGSKVRSATVVVKAPIAQFSSAFDNGNYKIVHFTNESVDATTYAWDFGDGETSTEANPQHEYAADGTYTVTLTASAQGGTNAISKQIKVEKQAAPNLITGGDMSDASKWTVLNIGAGVNSSFSGGKLTFTGGSWGHQGVYQTITVEANKTYKFDMNVAGSGASDTWFEVYFGTDAPVQGSDYTSGGNRLGLNTWTGCGKTAFDASMLSIACTGSLLATSGEVEFAQAGTIYVVIRTGGANLGTSGISVDNVDFRAIE